MLVVLGVSVTSAMAEDVVKAAVTMDFGDVSAMKQRAEAGDVRAQVALAGTQEGQFHAAEALSWYRKAAAAGNMEGVYHVGRMLLFGQTGIPHSETVAAEPTEGIRWTYMAATNFYTKAFGNLSGAYQRGLGVSTNLVESYAWLQLYLDVDPNPSSGRFYMNRLALQMDGASIAEGKRLAERYKQHQWPALLVRQMPDQDSRLKLNGITWGGRVPLAIINGKSIAAGEGATVHVGEKALRVKVLKIEKSSVIISLEGEDEPRVLKL